ncbi:GntR family transcriptional regulator [Agrococcus jejuensis]|uniref:Transcriptional regulator, GntR family n=1 Tax=Agrococcus jejuensis TaxID=399736 RepID=A0A1G8H345_9MICO|nr:GntR family transcriptional regulator [Agrococcus jejuensis]SDI01102.1 transcriptional regulator, GntR family [Agrococcus jejuensis]
MHVVLSTDSASPIYEQIKVQMRAAILSGAIAAGGTLPSLRQLAADLRVSVVTVTRAYNDLVAEGLARNEHGRGFVVLAVEADVAQQALDATLDDLLRRLVVAAGHAGVDLPALHRRLDDQWRSE